MKPNVRPIGVGDLKIVKQRLARYEAGELAHIENVLAHEKRDRQHRRLRQFEEIVTTIAEILDVEFVKILELEPGDAELLLRAGHGWRPGAVGAARESTGRHSQAGYALAFGGPVIVTDLKSETRFEINTS